MSTGHPQRTTYGACGKCGYDVTHVIGTSDRCPECGAHLARVGVTPRSTGTKRLPILLLLIGVLLVMGLLVTGFWLSVMASHRAAARAAAVRAAAAPAPAPAQSATPISEDNEPDAPTPGRPGG